MSTLASRGAARLRQAGNAAPHLGKIYNIEQITVSNQRKPVPFSTLKSTSPPLADKRDKGRSRVTSHEPLVTSHVPHTTGTAVFLLGLKNGVATTFAETVRRTA